MLCIILSVNNLFCHVSPSSQLMQIIYNILMYALQSEVSVMNIISVGLLRPYSSEVRVNFDVVLKSAFKVRNMFSWFVSLLPCLFVSVRMCKCSLYPVFLVFITLTLSMLSFLRTPFKFFFF